MEGGKEEKKVFGALTVYRERGAFLRRRELYEKAKNSLDEALKNNPEDVTTLIGRSLVKADPEAAESCIVDANLAMQLDPRNLYARFVKANALFTMSNFEHSLLDCQQGVRARKQPPYFTDGINRAEAVIQECIGKNAGQVMLNFLPIIKQTEDKMTHFDTYAPTPSKRVSRIPTVVTEKKLTQLEKRKHELLSRVMAMKYLGPMARDKFFLQNILKDPAIFSANSKGSLELHQIISEAVRSLKHRQEMLRSQRPYYTVKLAEKSESKHYSEFKKRQLINERISNAHTANVLLSRIQEHLCNKHVQKLMAAAEQLQAFLDSKSPRTLPDIDSITERLYRLVGRGYLCQYRLSYTLSPKSNRRRVAFLMGLPVGRPSSYDSVQAKYPFQLLEPKQAFQKMLQHLETCENDYMRCWILHELARLTTILKNYALAKFYAKRCQRQAQEVGSVSWWLNGCIMLLSGDMQQGNLSDIRNSVEEAYKYALKEDNINVQTFLKKCQEMASTLVTTDENKEIVQRERDILNVLDPIERTKVDLLLKRTARVPTGRRFYVLPKKRPIDFKTTSERKRAYQSGLSVIQGPAKSVPCPPHTKTLGTMKFDY